MEPIKKTQLNRLNAIQTPEANFGFCGNCENSDFWN